MIHAIIENGAVTNLIELNWGNAADFPSAVPTNGVQVAIGDQYTGGTFYRGDVPVGTAETAQMKQKIDTMEMDYGEALVDVNTRMITLELGLSS